LLEENCGTLDSVLAGQVKQFIEKGGDRNGDICPEIQIKHHQENMVPEHKHRVKAQHNDGVEDEVAKTLFEEEAGVSEMGEVSPQNAPVSLWWALGRTSGALTGFAFVGPFGDSGSVSGASQGTLSLSRGPSGSHRSLLR